MRKSIYKFSWNEIDILSQRWKQLADENKGEFKVIKVNEFGHVNDSTIRKFRLTIPFLNGKIILLTTEFKPLKVSYSFNTVNFNEFLIYPEDFTDRIGKLFGLKEIEIGDNEFDRNFIIKCDNDEFIKKLLTKELKRFMLENDISNFKLEKIEHDSILEMNIAINELDTHKVMEVLKAFKEFINRIQ